MGRKKVEEANKVKVKNTVGKYILNLISERQIETGKKVLKRDIISEISVETGFSYELLNKISQDDTRVVSLPNALILAEYFGVEVGELFQLEDADVREIKMCESVGCDYPAIARGLCSYHYSLETKGE